MASCGSSIATHEQMRLCSFCVIALGSTSSISAHDISGLQDLTGAHVRRAPTGWQPELYQSDKQASKLHGRQFISILTSTKDPPCWQTCIVRSTTFELEIKLS